MFLLSGLLALGAAGLACDRGESPHARGLHGDTCGCDESGGEDSYGTSGGDDEGGSGSTTCDENGLCETGGAETGGEETGGEGCTLTQGYWKNHSEYAKNPSQFKPWPIDEDTQLCGASWYEILHTPPKGDAWLILAHQWIAASLNVASGAEAPPEVAAALAEAEGYLADCTISPEEHDAALAASELLDGFNNGAFGPGHCGDGETGGEETDGGGSTGPGEMEGEETDGNTHGEESGSETGPSWPIPG